MTTPQAFAERLHRDVSDLKGAMDLQGDNLRKELGVATAGFRADVTGLREMVSMRLQKVDGQFRAVHADLDQRFTAVDERFDAVDRRFENVETQLRDLRAGMDAILSEVRRPSTDAVSRRRGPRALGGRGPTAGVSRVRENRGSRLR